MPNYPTDNIANRVEVETDELRQVEVKYAPIAVRVDIPNKFKEFSIADATDPATSTGLNASNYPYILLEIVLSGDDTTATFTPCYIGYGGTSYAHGSKITVNAAENSHPFIMIPSNLTTNFNLRCNSITGSDSPSATLYISLYKE